MVEFVLFLLIGAPIGIAGASFTLIFSLTTGIIKKLLSITYFWTNRRDLEIESD